MSLLLLLLACGKQAAVDPEPIDNRVEPSTAASLPPEPAPPEVLVGTWIGAPCGLRSYDRHLTIQADHTWNSQDRVSPCPPGAMCVWSGVIPLDGTWAEDGDGIAMTLTGTADARGVPLPSRVVVRQSQLHATEGDTDCAYDRKEVSLPDPAAP